MKTPRFVCLLLPLAFTIAAHSAEPAAKIRLEFREIPVGNFDCGTLHVQ